MAIKKIDQDKVAEMYEELGGELKAFEKLGGEVDVGYRVVYEKKISEVDVLFFGLASGDMNPIHFSEEEAAKTKFGARVVHGMLTTSLASAAVARMPGVVVLLENYFKYLAPVRIGDTVRVEEVVTEKEGRRYRVEVRCFTGSKVVAEGYLKVLIW
ncbi:MAG: MaoC family dehydratase [Candidatus Nezhaarchaeota archaeon]|nr:MaoC family dehydratase [Candidatus Nezhaarchaeota archaeon]